jgi:multiple sugar transport system substrate-binding protein
MRTKGHKLTRRDFLKGTAAGSGVLLANSTGISFAERMRSVHFLRRAQIETINILINQSPWLAGFQALVTKYTDDTGNKVTLTETPFAGMLQKSLNAVQADASEFDLLCLNEQWYMQFYAGGLVTRIKDIDPTFELDPNVIEYDSAPRWDPTLRYSSPNGEIYGLPINGNIQLFFYRKDLLDGASIAVPTTWDEVGTAAAALANPPQMYGFSIRTQPGNWEFQAYLYSYGTGIINLGSDGTWTVGFANNAAALAALNEWIMLGKTYGPPNVASLGQADNLALMESGHLAMVHMVGAAGPNFDDPNQSTVGGKMGASVVPGGPAGRVTMSGIWVMGIPHNLTDSRKVSALTFMQYALTKDAQLYYAQQGAIPVRQDVYEEMATDPKSGGWMQAMAESTPYIKAQVRINETPQVVDVVDRRINQALVGELTPEDALTQGAQEIYTILKDGGYNVNPLQ